MIDTKCKQCERIFRVRKVLLAKGWGKFCSSACQYRAAIKKVPLECSICKRQILRTPSKVLHSKSKKYFCGKSCQTTWRNKFYSGDKHLLWKGGFNMKHRKIAKEAGLEQVCLFCSTRDARVMVVHHIDKDRSNNTLQNLVWLCHNCHYRVHHDFLSEEIFKRKLSKFRRSQAQKNLV